MPRATKCIEIVYAVGGSVASRNPLTYCRVAAFSSQSLRQKCRAPGDTRQRSNSHSVNVLHNTCTLTARCGVPHHHIRLASSHSRICLKSLQIRQETDFYFKFAGSFTGDGGKQDEEIPHQNRKIGPVSRSLSHAVKLRIGRFRHFYCMRLYFRPVLIIIK
jgi:hypothetical protein